MAYTALHSGWTLRAVSGPVPAAIADNAIPATVPGCVHTDLLAAGVIADPFDCLLYTSPSPRDGLLSRMPSSA